MGVYMSSPITQKHSDSGGDLASFTQYGVTSMQGWRYTMEDAHVTFPSMKNSIAMYGVFDGHGGSSVSTWISRHIKNVFEDILSKYESLSEEDLRESSCLPHLSTEFIKYAKTLETTFLQLDVEMQTETNLKELKEIQDQNKDQEERSLSAYSLMQNTQFVYYDENEVKYYITPDEAFLYNFEKFLPHNSSKDEDVKDENIQESSQTSPFSHEIEESVTESQLKQDVSTNNKSNQNSIELESEIKENNKESTFSSSIVTENKGDENQNDQFEENNDLEVSQEEILEVGNTENSQENNFNDSMIFSPVLKNEATDESNEFDSKNDQPVEEKEIHDICGATAIVALFVTFPHPSIIIANAGDSRAVLCRNGRAVPLSYDHKPFLPVELQRIQNAGGSVLGGRVDGNLNLSRSLGDLSYKKDAHLEPQLQRITAFPDITIVNLVKEDEFIVIACDGIWDCKSNQAVVDFILGKLNPNSTPNELSAICESLCDECVSKSPEVNEGLGCDNMTCVIVKINSNLFLSSNSQDQSIVFYNYSPEKNTLPNPTS